MRKRTVIPLSRAVILPCPSFKNIQGILSKFLLSCSIFFGSDCKFFSLQLADEWWLMLDMEAVVCCVLLGDIPVSGDLLHLFSAFIFSPECVFSFIIACGFSSKLNLFLFLQTKNGGGITPCSLIWHILTPFFAAFVATNITWNVNIMFRMTIFIFHFYIPVIPLNQIVTPKLTLVHTRVDSPGVILDSFFTVFINLDKLFRFFRYWPSRHLLLEYFCARFYWLLSYKII